ncbi:MAG: hypothetical protein KF726_02895 [Anaerolineae bacterium]|nr:hypothetical protein [Anaerolineae bacterium]
MQVESANNFQVDEPASLTTMPNWYSNFAKFLPNTLERYTMDQLFDFAAQKIQNEPIPPVIAWCGAVDGNPTRLRYEVAFDQEKGYITALAYTSCVKYDWGIGLLCPVISDCRAGFNIHDLQPLP